MNHTMEVSLRHRKLVWALAIAAVLVFAGLRMVRWTGTQPLAEVPDTPVGDKGAATPPAAWASSPWAVQSLKASTLEQGTSSRASGAAPPTAMGMADWTRYPGGLMAGMDQALQQQDGRGAYELVRILARCAGLSEEMERSRQLLSDMQTQGLLKQGDRHLTDTILSSMQRDQAHCQTLAGDLQGKRRQLLEVAARQGVEGAGMSLYADGVHEPWVMRQVLREAELGQDTALTVLALGDVPQASRLQRDAARDVLVRGVSDLSMNSPADRYLQRSLDRVASQVALEAWKADPGNTAKTAVAKAAYLGQGAPALQPSTDPEVRALSDQYLAALKRRRVESGRS